MKSGVTSSLFPEAGLQKQTDFTQLYTQVYHQLKKDFHPHIEIEPIPENLNSEWLEQEVYRMITKAVSERSQSLAGIINRVDLSEYQLRKYVTALDEKKKLTALSKLILKREALKVWIRHNYTSANKADSDNT
ncbi:MAG: hypothetical protein ACKVOR_00830 [Flavobacteriales bacterium]